MNNNNDRLIPFLGGLVLGGVGGSVIDNNRYPYNNNYYPVYNFPYQYPPYNYYQTNTYQQLPTNSYSYPCGMPLHNAAYNMWRVALLAWGCSFGSASASVKVCKEILCTQRNSGRDAVHYNTNKLSVWLSKHWDSESLSVAVHLVYLFSLPTKEGNDLSIHLISSTSTWYSSTKEAI